MTITKSDLRKQLEFEFRSKLIHLRRAYLRSSEDDIDEIILDAIPTMAPIIGGLMHIKDIDGKFDTDKFKNAYGIDIQVLRDIYYVRKGKGKLEGDKKEYIRKLIYILTEIGKAVNEMVIAPHELTV